MNVKTQPTTISLKGEPMFKEAPAKAALKPGHLIELTFTGSQVEVQKDSGKGTGAQKTVWAAFALENDLIGKGVTDEYPIGENVRYGVFHSGQEILARVAASAPNIGIGEFLESAADGTLRAAIADTTTDTTQRGAIRFQSLEKLDSPGSETFLKVEVL